MGKMKEALRSEMRNFGSAAVRGVSFGTESEENNI